VIWLAVAAVVLVVATVAAVRVVRWRRRWRVERLAPLEHDAPREALRAAIERRQR
jgi:heme/copper-type cytochrome/quinol oxidase subunit 2